MYRSVNWIIFLFVSSVKSLLPYSEGFVNSLFERFKRSYQSKDTSEKISSMYFKRRTKQQEMLRILNAIVRRARRIYGIPKIVSEFMKVQLAEPNSQLGKAG